MSATLDGRTGQLPRVIHVSTAHPADDVRIFERECRSLAASGRYDVYLAAAGQLPAGSGVTLIPLEPAPVSRLHRFWTGPRKAFALSQSLSADLWHFHDPELLPVAYALARSGRQVIWDAHEDYESQFTQGGGKSWVPGAVRGLVGSGTKTLLSAVDHRVAAVVAATPTVASRYRNERTVVVGNETRLEVFADCRPKFDAGQLLFTGTPGPAHLFREVVAAVAQTPQAQLKVAGRIQDAETWDWAERVLGSRITHLGWLGRDELAEAMSASSLGLLTYADTDAYSVASPTKSFEFAAAGLPMIATPNQMNVQALGSSSAGFLADGFTAEALHSAISQALGDEESWTRASLAGRRWATENGSWSHSENRLLRLYAELLHTSRDS